MSTKHEIILIDGGDDIRPEGMDSGRPSMPSRPASPGSSYSPGSDSGGSSRKKAKDEGDAKGAAWELAGAISKALGGIAFVDTALRLKKAFEDIYNAVTKLDERINKVDEPGARPAPEPGGTSTSKPSRKRGAKVKEPEEDFIEGEFTVSRPTSESVSERGLSVPSRGMSLPTGEVDDAMGAMTKRAAGAGEIGAAKTIVTGGEAVAGAGAAAGGEAAAGLAGVAAAAGPLAIAIGGITVAAVAGGIALKALFDTLSNEVKRLEGISAEVSVAASMSEVRREMADMRRAEQIGPDLARFENVRSKLEDKTADLWTQVLKVLLNIFEVIEPGVTVVTNGIGVATSQIELVNTSLDQLKAAATLNREDDAKAAAEHFGALARAAIAMERFVKGQEEKEEDFDDPFLKGFLGQFAAGGQI